MINTKELFVAVYTNKCKSYCDRQFFNHLLKSDIGEATVKIVDNTIDTTYRQSLEEITKLKVTHLQISRQDKETQFLRNVCNSVNYLRGLFLKTECKYFLIVESDVLPPYNFISMFSRVIDIGDIIGGIYYSGFHPQEMFEYDNIIERVPTVLSGCTLYKREIIERFSFRWHPDQKNAFPDAWISFEARHSGYRLINYSKIQCNHLTKKNSGSRGMEDME